MLGDVIKDRRKVVELTQKELAIAAEVDQTMISKTEANKIKPSIRTLEKIAHALGTSASELLSVSGKSNEKSTN